MGLGLGLGGQWSYSIINFSLNLACMLATVLVVASDMLYNYYKVIRYTLGAWLCNRY